MNRPGFHGKIKDVLKFKVSCRPRMLPGANSPKLIPIGNRWSHDLAIDSTAITSDAASDHPAATGCWSAAGKRQTGTGRAAARSLTDIARRVRATSNRRRRQPPGRAELFNYQRGELRCQGYVRLTGSEPTSAAGRSPSGACGICYKFFNRIPKRVAALRIRAAPEPTGYQRRRVNSLDTDLLA